MSRSAILPIGQRNGRAPNLDAPSYMLTLDGVYIERPDGALRFRRVAAPTERRAVHQEAQKAFCPGLEAP